MDDVAAEAGYSRRSLYRFFPSKDDIAAALAIRSGRLLSERLAPVGSLALFDIAWAYFQASRERPDVFRVVLDTREWLASGRPMPMKSELTEELGAMVTSLGPLLGPGDGEPMAAALGYVEFLFRYRTTWEATGLSGDDEAVRRVLEQLLCGATPATSSADS